MDQPMSFLLVHKACDCSEHFAVNTALCKASHLKCNIRPDVTHIINKLCAFALCNNPSWNTNQWRRGRSDNHIYLASFQCCKNGCKTETEIVEHSHYSCLFLHANCRRVQNLFSSRFNFSVPFICRAGNYHNLITLVDKGIHHRAHSIRTRLGCGIILIRMNQYPHKSTVNL